MLVASVVPADLVAAVVDADPVAWSHHPVPADVVVAADLAAAVAAADLFDFVVAAQVVCFVQRLKLIEHVEEAEPFSPHLLTHGSELVGDQDTRQSDPVLQRNVRNRCTCSPLWLMCSVVREALNTS